MIIKRLGIVGDIHGADEHLALALTFLREADVDAIVCNGDITDGIGHAGRCCELLEEHGVITVFGNHDRWFLSGEMRDLPIVSAPEEFTPKTRKFLKSLPGTLPLQTVSGALLLCHGMGENDMRSLLIDDGEYALHTNDELQHLLLRKEFRYVICGHTHRRMVRRFEGLTVINPGPIRDIHESGLTIADFASGTAQFYDLKNGDTVPCGEPVTL